MFNRIGMEFHSRVYADSIFFPCSVEIRYLVCRCSMQRVVVGGQRTMCNFMVQGQYEHLSLFVLVGRMMEGKRSKTEDQHE